jgi:hypothetical protein
LFVVGGKGSRNKWGQTPLCPLRYNTVSIWHALDQEQTPPTAEPLPQPAWLLIWRKEWQPHFRTLHAAEHAALSQLHEGASFAEVCANLSEQFSEEEAAAVAAEGLRTWLGDELIVGLTGIYVSQVGNPAALTYPVTGPTVADLG